MEPPPPQSSSTCPVCNDRLLIITDPDSGETICSKCGMIVLDKIQNINQPERHAFSNEEHENRSRTGIPTSLAIHDMGLATVIGRADRDASGKKIDAVMHTSMQRLRTWDSRTHVRRSDKSLIQALNELQILKHKLALPYVVVEKAAYIYRKAHDRKLARGRAVSGLIAASVYIACREMSTTRTLNDVAAASNIKRKQLTKAYRFLVMELDIKVPLADQTKCINKVANKANLSEKTKRQAIRIMDEIKRKDYGNNALLYSAGKNPMGFAGTILYLSCLKTGENKTQVDIADAAGVTEVTLRNRLKDLKSKLEELLKAELE
ncbi:MAG: transcription initiation factor IIB family protein [Nitrososphaeraceae archaeon]